MSTVRRLSIPVMVAGAIAVLSATVAFAQTGPSNPSGGTSLRQTTFEGTGSFSQPAPMTRSLPGLTAWQGFSFSLSQYAFSTTTRVGEWRLMPAIVRRSPARR